MQSTEQPAQDSSERNSSDSVRDWPPKMSRLVLGALVAAGLGYIVLQTLFPIFVVPLEIATFPEQSPAWMYERLDKANVEVDAKNYSVVFGILGAVFGASCCVFSYGMRAIWSVIIAGIASGLLGVAGAHLSNWLFSTMRANSGNDVPIMGIALDGMKLSIVGYSLLWGLIGLGVGCGIGSARGFGKSLVAGISGLVGGILGAMLYVILTAQFSIGTVMNQVAPISGVSQAIWLGLFTVVIAVTIALGCGEKRPKNA